MYALLDDNGNVKKDEAVLLTPRSSRDVPAVVISRDKWLRAVEIIVIARLALDGKLQPELEEVESILKAGW